MSDPALINYVPVLAESMSGWAGAKIYHCVDRWDAFEMYDSALMADCDARACQLADLILASSKDLAERCEQNSPNVMYLPHGVDVDHFASALTQPSRPRDLPEGPIIGYFGLLSEWVDQQLLVEVAEACPDATMVLIGGNDVPVTRLEQHDRICLLGPRPFTELPAYIAHFSVGMIPFEVNDLTRAVNPIKLREMLSAGCPVVSTDLPECRGLGDGVYVEDRAGFVDAVASVLRHPPSRKEREGYRQAMEDQSWERRVGELIQAIARMEAP